MLGDAVAAAGFRVECLASREQTLEEMFLRFYGEGTAVPGRMMGRDDAL